MTHANFTEEMAAANSMITELMGRMKRMQELHEEAPSTNEVHVSQESDDVSVSRGLCCCRKQVLHSGVVQCKVDTIRIRENGKLVCRERKSGDDVSVRFQERLDESTREIHYEGTISVPDRMSQNFSIVEIEPETLSAAALKGKGLTGKKRSGHTSECGRLSFGYSYSKVYKTGRSTIDYLNVDYEVFHCKVRKGSCTNAFGIGWGTADRFPMASAQCRPGFGWAADRLPELCA